MDYIKAMLGDYNGCSKSHGCWHSRAHNLAKLHNININPTERRKHEKHIPGNGPFPPSSDHAGNSHDTEIAEIPSKKNKRTRIVA